jgi:Arc/MetJ family transcription regulator
MTTTLEINEKLLAEVHRLSGKRSKQAAVNAVLRDYVERRRQQLKAIELMGQFDWDPNYDYKAERRRKRGGTGK